MRDFFQRKLKQSDFEYIRFEIIQFELAHSISISHNVAPLMSIPHCVARKILVFHKFNVRAFQNRTKLWTPYTGSTAHKSLSERVNFSLIQVADGLALSNFDIVLLVQVHLTVDLTKLIETVDQIQLAINLIHT